VALCGHNFQASFWAGPGAEGLLLVVSAATSQVVVSQLMISEISQLVMSQLMVSGAISQLVAALVSAISQLVML